MCKLLLLSINALLLFLSGTFAGHGAISAGSSQQNEHSLLHHNTPPAVSSREMCGMVDRKDMEHFVYIPDREYNKDKNANGANKPNEPVSILIDSRKWSGGAFANVFHGYLGSREEEFSVEKCVAIRLTKKERIQAAENCFRTIRAIKDELEPSERSHVIEIFDIGRSKTTGDYVVIMELAKGSYEDLYIPREFEEGKDASLEDALKNEIANMVKPLEQFNKVAIHLDLKMANFVVMETGRVKLIDFDCSLALSDAVVPPRNGGARNAAARANCPIKPLFRGRWDEFSGPEYEDKKCVRVTTKTDIWSVGMLVYGLILMQPSNSLSGNSKAKKKQRSQLLSKIADLYRGYTWVDTNKVAWMEEGVPFYVKRSQPLVYDQALLVQYADALLTILSVRQQQPEVFLLLTNILHLNRGHRMSGSGVQQYLSGECRPLLEYAPNSVEGKSKKDLVLFGKINARNLAQLADDALTNNNKLQLPDREVVSKKLEQIHKMLVDDRETANFNRVLWEVEQRGETCAH